MWFLNECFAALLLWVELGTAWRQLGWERGGLPVRALLVLGTPSY